MGPPPWKSVLIFIFLLLDVALSLTRDHCQLYCSSRVQYYSRYQRNQNFLNGFSRLCLKQCGSALSHRTTRRPVTVVRTTPTTTPTTTASSTTQSLRNTTSDRPRVFSGSCGISEIVKKKIIGGVDAEECEFPWMVGVQVPDNWCGGTIVDASHVLTAAHCLLTRTDASVQHRVEDIRVLAGSSSRRSLVPHTIIRRDASEKYNLTNKDYDLAMLTLSEPLQLGKCVKPICLPKVGDRPEDSLGCSVAGWGLTYNPSPVDSQRRQPFILQKVDVPIVPNHVCGPTYNNRGVDYINERRLCSGDIQRGGKDSCGGDSGGPLMCKVRDSWVTRYVQFGIVSFGSPICGKASEPGVYMRLAHPEILNFVGRFVRLD